MRAHLIVFSVFTFITKVGQMRALISVSLFCSYLAAFSVGNLDLLIIKHEDGCGEPVEASVQVRLGSTFSLGCRIVSLATGRQFNRPVIMGRKRKHLRFLNVDLGKTSNLTFTRVTHKEQGGYFCAAPQYKLFKVAYVIVRSADFKNHSSRKPKRSISYSIELDQLPGESTTQYPKNASEFLRTNRTYAVQKHPKVYAKKRNRAEDMLKITGIVYCVTIAVYTCYHVIKCWCDGKFSQSPDAASSPVLPQAIQRCNNPRRSSARPLQTENTPMVSRDVRVELGRSLAFIIQTGHVEDLLGHLEQFRPSHRNYGCTLPPSYEEAVYDARIGDVGDRSD